MEKNLDRKGRWRNVTVAFRMSQAESDDLNQRVKISGLTKQEYITNRLQERDVVVQGNPRVYRALRNTMTDIFTELKRLERSEDVNSEMMGLIELIAQTLDGMKEETEWETT